MSLHIAILYGSVREARAGIRLVHFLDAVLRRLVEEILRLLALSHQASLHVRERGDDGVDRAGLDFRPQLVEGQH